MEKIILLGASGSIGSQTLEILLENPLDFELTGVSVGHRVGCLETILSSFPSVRTVCVREREDSLLLKEKYPRVEFVWGDRGLIELIDRAEASLVVNSLVGFVGFLPSLHCLEKGIDLALANKESLVVGGNLLKEARKKTGANLYAIDSEHCALAKCLEGKNPEDVRNLVLTASGGSFRDFSPEELKTVDASQALAHPSWAMGKKITIDSATMMNKGFEVIEAMHLFGFPKEKIKVLLHDESVIHSMVEFKDGSYLADLGPTDMKVAIAYALYRNHRHEVRTKPLCLEELSGLHFRKRNPSLYPCLELAFRAIGLGGDAPAVLNRSNEEAVYAFLNGEIRFTEIAEVVENVLSEHRVKANPNREDIIDSDKWAKNKSMEWIRRIHECNY